MLRRASGLPQRSRPPALRTRKGIDDLDARGLEILAVACGNDETMDQRRRRNQAVLDGHGAAGHPKASKQRRPSQARFRLPGQTLEPLNTRCKPSFEPGTSLSLREKENAEPNLSENNRIDGEIRFVRSQPVDDVGIRSRFCGLTQ